MARPLSPWADRVRIMAWAAVVVLLASAHVAGFTTDSDSYLDVAANLRAGRGLVQTAVDFWRPGVPDPLGMWPPLYPLAIAAISLCGIALESAARLVSGLSFVAFALGFHTLARRAGGRGFAFVTALLALLGPALAQAGAMAWSESLYLALATWGLVGALDLAAVRGSGAVSTPLRAALAGACLGLAADTRYLGLVLLPTVFVLLAAARLRASTLLAWAIGAAVAVAPWLVHGLVAFGRPLGPALPVGGMPWPRALSGLAGAARWEFLPYPLAAVAGVAAAALAGVAIAWLWAVRRPGAVRWAAWVAVMQLAAVGAAAARLGINDPNGRYTVVAWPFLTLVAAAGALAALRRVPAVPSRAGAAEIATAALALALFGAGLGRFLATTATPPAAAAARAHDAAALRTLAGATPGPILSDRGQLLRLVTGRAAVQVPPPRYRVREFGADDAARWWARGVRVAIFRMKDRPALGVFLEQRTMGGAGAWAVEDSAGGFARWRVTR